MAFSGGVEVLRYDLSVRQGDGTWPSLVKALVWGTREPGFKSRRPDYVTTAQPGHSARSLLVALAVSTTERGQPGWQWYPDEPQADGTVPRVPRFGGGRVLLRRAFLAALALLDLLIVATSVLLLATPSVGNAWSLARAEARSHHERFPRPAGSREVRGRADRHRGPQVRVRAGIRSASPRPGADVGCDRQGPGRRHACTSSSPSCSTPGTRAG